MNVLTRAYELALQGRNDALSAVDRNAIAKEVTQLKNTMMGLANRVMRTAITCSAGSS